MIAYLKENGISTGIYFPVPLHLLGAHSDLNHKSGDFPVTEYISKNSVAIPMYPELTIEEIDYIISKVNHFEEIL